MLSIPGLTFIGLTLDCFFANCFVDGLLTLPLLVRLAILDFRAKLSVFSFYT